MATAQPTGYGELARYCPTLDDSPEDLSGNSNDGTYQGSMGTATASPAPGGSRYYLHDGSDDRISLPSLFGTPTEGTVCLFFKSDNSTVAQRVFSYSDSTDSVFLLLRINAGANDDLQWLAYDGANQTVTKSSAGVTSWRHAACTWKNGDVIELFVDGTSAGTAGFGTATDAAPNGKNIGSSRSDTIFFDGGIADVILFDRVLTSGEITNLSGEDGFVLPAGEQPSHLIGDHLQSVHLQSSHLG